MNPYLFTVAFLMMMSFLTSSEAIRFAQNTLEKKCYLDSRHILVVAEELRELSHLENLRDEVNPNPKPRKKIDAPLKKSTTYVKKARALGVNAARPPDNSRLNVYTLFHKEPSKGLPEEFSLYEVIARTMRALYQEELLQEIANAEYRILDRLIEKKEECAAFTSPDQLCEIDLEDADLQKIFYHMLKGTKKSASLLNYLTFEKIDDGSQARKINLLFVDPLVLQAIFPKGSAAERLLERRNQILNEIEYQEAHRLELSQEECKGRLELSKDLKKALEEILTSEGLNAKKYKSQVFDCTLSKPGTVIFLEDPFTGRFIREKYTPQKHLSSRKK